MKRNIGILLIVALTVAAMIYTAAKKSNEAKNAAPGDTVALGSAKGKSAPDFTLKTMDGKEVTLSSLRGKAVLLNFWATYCGPCKIEMPWFEDLQKKYASQGLVIVGVVVDDVSDEKVNSFVKDMKVDYTILRGTEKVADLYGGVEGLPTTFFIGRDGKIVDSSLGLVSLSEIEDNIKKSLAQGGDAQATNAQPAATIPAKN